MKTDRGTIDTWITDHAAATPNKTALHFEDRIHTYADLYRLIDLTATVLSFELHLERGERIAYYGYNSDEMVILAFAAARLGLIFVPLNWRLATPELNYICMNCSPKVLFHDDAFAENVPALTENVLRCLPISVESGRSLAKLRQDTAGPEHLRPSGATIEDPFLIVYTSGTTGYPKGAVLTQEAVLANAEMSVHAHGMTENDRILNFLPMFHVGGLNILTLPALYRGAEVVIARKFDPRETIRLLQDKKITLAVLVPTAFGAMMETPEWAEADLSSLRMLSLGSTDVPIRMIEAIHERGVPAIQIYGATETAPLAIYQQKEDAHSTVGSIGRQGSRCEIKLVADPANGEAGEAGEIWVKGPNVFTGYWQDDALTAEALVDGWFRTGDIARVDENGFYWFLDRAKHVVISGGENIYPAELERILREIPGVRESCVVGRADPKWGEVPVAVVIKGAPDLSERDVLSAFEGKLARYKLPKAVIFVEELPRNALGKIVVQTVKTMIADDRSN